MHYRYLSLLATGWLALAASCQKADEAPGCGTPATVRNLTGLDGCGYVLQLDNGKRLEPHGTLQQGFAKHDGDRVTISYEPEPAASICMVGDGVKLTCLQARQRRWLAYSSGIGCVAAYYYGPDPPRCP